MFRQQSAMQRENIAIITDQYKKVQEIYKRKMADMNDRLGKEAKKMGGQEERRKLELEGYSSDLQQMKKKIGFYQKYISKLRKLVEEERIDDEDAMDELSNEDNGEGEEEDEDGHDHQ